VAGVLASDLGGAVMVPIEELALTQEALAHLKDALVILDTLKWDVGAAYLDHVVQLVQGKLDNVRGR
jgi:hypothetical protein